MLKASVQKLKQPHYLLYQLSIKTVCLVMFKIGSS